MLTHSRQGQQRHPRVSACNGLSLEVSRSTTLIQVSYKLQVKNFGSAPTTKRTQVHYKLSRVK